MNSIHFPLIEWRQKEVVWPRSLLFIRCENYYCSKSSTSLLAVVVVVIWPLKRAWHFVYIVIRLHDEMIQKSRQIRRQQRLQENARENGSWATCVFNDGARLDAAHWRQGKLCISIWIKLWFTAKSHMISTKRERFICWQSEREKKKIVWDTFTTTNQQP